MCERVRTLGNALQTVGLGGGQGPPGAEGARWASGCCLAERARCPARRPSRSLPSPPPERPSAGVLEARRRPGTDAGVGQRCSRASLGGREGRAGTAPPLSAGLALPKLRKQKDSDYLSGAGAGSSAVRLPLPGAGRVFSSRKAGGAPASLRPRPEAPGASAGASAAWQRARWAES